MKLGSKFRPNSKVYGLFMPTCCLPLMRCERWPGPGLSNRGREEGKRNSCRIFLQRNSFDWSGTWVFPCFKAVSNDDYVLEGGNTALSVTRFLRGNLPWGFITLRIKELFIFQKVKLGGDLETFAALSLWLWVRFWAGMLEIHSRCVPGCCFDPIYNPLLSYWTPLTSLSCVSFESWQLCKTRNNGLRSQRQKRNEHSLLPTTCIH